MHNQHDGELKESFLMLLKELDPDIESQPEVAKEFAQELLAFTEGWAADFKSIEGHETRLGMWINQNARKNTDQRLRVYAEEEDNSLGVEKDE